MFPRIRLTLPIRGNRRGTFNFPGDKMIKFYIYTLMFFCLGASAEEVLPKCNLGYDKARNISVVRDEKSGDAYTYYFSEGEKKHFFFAAKESSRGTGVQTMCVGDKLHALVSYGKFEGKDKRGIVIIMAVMFGQLDRVDFDYENPPEWLYIKPRHLLIVMPKHEANGKTKYIVYPHFIGSLADDEPYEADALPLADNYEVIKLSK
jgi:hypothetical protein